MAERQVTSIIELFQMFPDEVSARKWLEDIIWPDGERHCPHCGSCTTKTVKTEKPMPYHCGDCRKYFSVKTGTVMQSSKIPLQKWVIAMYLMSTRVKGVSSMQLHRDLGITQKTAWFLAQRIREGWIEGGKLSGTVEVDETYMGGKEKNKHSKKRLRAGRGGVGKTAVIGARSRDGTVRAISIPRTNGYELEKFINENVEHGSHVFTDEHKGYTGLWRRYVHRSVCHSAGEYVDGDVHTNGIESFWAGLKRGYMGTYHMMSPKHLDRYVTEFTGRHNRRGLDTLSQIRSLVWGMQRRRLRYKDLIA